MQWRWLNARLFSLQSCWVWVAAAVMLVCPVGAESAGMGEVERVLSSSWQSYKQYFLTPEGRVMIPERGGGSISEGQAYALLRAVWSGDEAVFARVYAWTHQNLSRSQKQGDTLLAWQWGQRPDGVWGVLDWNTATDADLDYALALHLAARRGWRAPPRLPDYETRARQVQQDILDKTVVRLGAGELILTPGNWQGQRPPILLNPSYFSPGAYRVFAQVTTGEVRWLALRQATYNLLERLTRGLGPTPAVGLFPDWCQVDAQGLLSPAPNRDTQFGWEAVRLPFRLALDGLWFGEKRAVRLLAEYFLPFCKRQWQAHHRLAAVYSFSGQPLVDYDSPVLYAGVLAAALAAGDRDFAHLMADKILSSYREQGRRAYFEAPDNYYANNWAWLGLALYAGWVKVFQP